MPVYEYLCDSCGPFTDMRPMAESDLPNDCPDCGITAPRVILTAPNFSGLSAERRAAYATNEKSQHAPQSSAEYKAQHGANCSCCASGKKSRMTYKTKSGAKSFPTARPWMISH
ncbi:zinc ribbon domain protein [Variibacter gotjawalensis]|uniref:Zinc ribbon domain protein n=1 Tax=Variibacter gotjawalensis TaxID=1333996 RepID=A0A0S3PUF1_9BRAD|nr:zinc ribbon domain-containing protein [Variibacter gotjawalensis]NIK49909.1 putative FmdB family regulatory protein [Variibacter gotjawalensis]RZS45908.1 putative FmdB family regulatory protein [Variibacter gotjawalensis]BAT59583.1 zinc ribbon domain protein [Variibacter gotjawalensis]